MDGSVFLLSLFDRTVGIERNAEMLYLCMGIQSDMSEWFSNILMVALIERGSSAIIKISHFAFNSITIVCIDPCNKSSDSDTFRANFCQLLPRLFMTDCISLSENPPMPHCMSTLWQV